MNVNHMKTYSAWPFEGLKQTPVRFLIRWCGSCFSSWLVLAGEHLCWPLLTMRRACTVLLALAAASLCSAEPDPHRPRQDSNLEICILPLLVDFKVLNAPPPQTPRCVFLTSWRQTSDCLKPRGKINWTHLRIWWSWTTSISSTR